VATRRADAHQRPARGANFGTRLLIAAFEETTHRASRAIQAHLPPIGKRQFSSLRTRTQRSYNTEVSELV
jgi:hypothetical protein